MGSAKIALRFYNVEEDRFEVRVLEGFEYFRLQGWKDEWFQRIPSELWNVEYLELLCNLAGNSYSIFHFIPWQCALWLTYGAHVQPPTALGQEIDVGDEAGSVQDVGSSSSLV